MAATTMVHVRVDENVKAQDAETLASMGLTISDAIRVVADKEPSFVIKAPNASSRAAMAEASEIIKSRRARFATADALIGFFFSAFLAATVPCGLAASEQTPAMEPLGTSVARAPTPAGPAVRIAVPAGSTAPAPVLHYVPDSSVKVEQLTGDYDKERRKPTLNQTASRWGIKGTDLGVPFEYNGKVYIPFGDIIRNFGEAPEVIATTTATDPEAGVKLDFLNHNGKLLIVSPPGIDMGPFNGTMSGIGLDGHLYFIIQSGWVGKSFAREFSVLTRFDPPYSSTSFHPLRTVSRMPGGHFVYAQAREQPGNIPGLPPGGPYVLMWGSDMYRKASLYLQVVPTKSFEDGRGTKYFASVDAAGNVTWSDREADAAPVINDAQFGGWSMAWCKELRLWLLAHDHQDPPGSLLAWSRTPWGPWQQLLLYRAHRDHALGVYLHDPSRHPSDGLAGPVVGIVQPERWEEVWGAAYAPGLIERWIKVEGGRLTLCYLQTSWNPYVTLLMKTAIDVLPPGSPVDLIPPAPWKATPPGAK